MKKTLLSIALGLVISTHFATAQPGPAVSTAKAPHPSN